MLTGRRLGVYHVQERIGAGGMGEVYRARDTRLGRDVAIKILPSAFTSDPERLARFEREARVLAALNHPNIATIHGVEEGEGIQALVLELVDGETLAERVARGPLKVADALAIAAQIADALDAAHERGIVHRDLKPANIKITPGGVVKVLDFGLAKSEGEPSAADLTHSPTLTFGGTTQGVILGTAAYMSPEQARGLVADKRTDIWAFGCVLYEMLTGQRAFSGTTVSDIIARILEREPDWDALPSAVSPAVRRLLKRCVDKDPRRRLRDIGDARADLADASLPATTSGTEPASRQRPDIWRMVAVAALGGVLVLSVVIRDRLAPAGVSSSVTRTTLTLPANQELDTLAGAAPIAISPDGRRVAYVALRDGRAQLYVRELDAFEPTIVTGTDGARYPFFSPDGEHVGFFADGKLKRVSIRGGSPEAICEVPVVGRGGTWGPDGTIVFDPGTSGLMRVRASGGNPERVTSRDSRMDARNLSWPQFLPDGRALLVTDDEGDAAGATLAALSLSTGEWQPLGRGSQAHYVASGHLLFHAPHVREGELQVVAFDVERLALRAAPTSVLDEVFRSEGGGGAYFAVASTGTLVFAPGGHARTLVKVDRSGRRTLLTEERRGFRHPRFSPDGRHLAVVIDPRPSQIWLYDLMRGSRIPVSTERHNLGIAWTPDGRRVTYSSGGDIYWRAADGSSAPERLLARDRAQYAVSWSDDEELLVFNDDHLTNRFDIWVMPRNGDPRPLLATPAHELDGRLSPDGRWLAYQSDESGRAEVYVRPFPNVDGGKWTVSTTGGLAPVWAPTGRELFYMSGTTLMSVTVESRGAEFSAGGPTSLFTGPFETGSPQFDVSPDGTYFVMVEADPDARPTRLQVVLNWSEELKRREAVSTTGR